MQLGLQVGDEDGAMVGGAKVMGCAERVAEVLLDDLVIPAIVEPDAVQVGSVLEIAYG